MMAQTLQSAFEHHRAGDLGRAEAVCRDALRVDPRHSDALHLLGVIALQRRENVTAFDCIGQAIDINGARPEYHNSLGNILRALGRPVDAVHAFGEAIRLKPDFSVAHNNLGIALAECGQQRGAAACFERAVQLDSKNSQAWTNLGRLLHKTRDSRDSTACFERAIEADPAYGPAYFELAKRRLRAGRIEQAIAAFEQALALLGESTPLLKELAASYLRAGRSADAERVYRRAIDRSPMDPELVLNLAQALKDQRKHAEAIDWYRLGLALDPHRAAAHFALGRALHLEERFAEAIDSYGACLALGSTDPRAAYFLGNACKSLKRLHEAVDAYLKALQWDPDFSPALYQLGNAYRQLEDFDAARMCYERVLERNSDDPTTLAALGNVMKSQDDQMGAKAAYEAVIRRLPDEPLWTLWLATLCPAVFHSPVGIDQYRSNLGAKLKSLAQRSISVSPEDIANRGCPPPYNLQFHGRDDRPIKEAYARLFETRIPLRKMGVPRLRPGGGKPRIGFVVTDAHEGVFLRYLGSVFERLDCEAYDPVIICSAAGELRIRGVLPPETVETFVIPSRFDQIVERIRAGAFAVLYFWEIGSDATNYFLPFFGLAPIQCTGAGLPVTSGIARVDYFLSNDACEPERAEHDYSERLIRSKSLLTWQHRMRRPDAPRTRQDFGIGDSVSLYLCPHKIEKLHPDLDGLFGEILRRDRHAILAIPRDRHGYAAAKLENRLRLALPHVSDRIRFVPYQSLDGYLSLIDAADVLLDPIYYGGGLTSLDAFSLGKPIVTLPGRYLRGRFTSGFYRTMGVVECVASSPEQYVEIAVRLGADRDWRMHVAERICDASDVLFEADDAVSEYDRIFRKLVDEAMKDG